MNKIKIITDSTSDLNYLYDELDIKVLPLSVIFGDKAYLDGVDIKTQDIYDKVKETGVLPKTAAIVPSVIIEEFKKWYDEGYDVIFTGISSKMSSTYQSAVLAAKEVDESGERIFVVDSGNLSSGIGLLLCKEKDKLSVEWSLEGICNPIGVSSYKIKNYIPEDILEKLPTEDDINMHIKID